MITGCTYRKVYNVRTSIIERVYREENTYFSLQIIEPPPYVGSGEDFRLNTHIERRTRCDHAGDDIAPRLPRLHVIRIPICTAVIAPSRVSIITTQKVFGFFELAPGYWIKSPGWKSKPRISSSLFFSVPLLSVYKIFIHHYRLSCTCSSLNLYTHTHHFYYIPIWVFFFRLMCRCIIWSDRKMAAGQIRH